MGNISTCGAMPAVEDLVWFGPTHETASIRHLKRTLESKAQVWFRRRDKSSALVYTTVPKQSRTSEAGVLLAVDLVTVPETMNDLEREKYIPLNRFFSHEVLRRILLIRLRIITLSPMQRRMMMCWGAFSLM